MPDDNNAKPNESPNQIPQNKPEEPRVIIPVVPRPDLTDYQTEGIKPNIEKKNQ